MNICRTRTTLTKGRINTQIPYQQRTLLFVPYLRFFWSNIRCEVEESALSRRGEVMVHRAAGRGQQMSEGPREMWSLKRKKEVNKDMIYS